MIEKQLIKLTKKLIKYRTVSGEKKEIEKAFFYIIKELTGLSCRRIHTKNTASLLAGNYSLADKKFDLILHGHIDVVPGDRSQFLPFEKNNRIYGRGALDMKGGLAVLIVLMKNLMREKINKKVLLMITSDEEVGGENGTKYLLHNLGYRGKFFITAEGEKKYWLKIQQKGVLMLKLKSYGRGGHSGYVWQGDNAITKLYRAYQAIEKLFPLTKKDHWQTTINLGKINGGLAVNSIPEYAEAEIDIRFCNNWLTADAILKAIKKQLAKFSKVEVEVKYQTPLMITDKNNPYLQKLYQAANKVLAPQKAIFYHNPGTNDARFATAVGIPATGFGPIGGNYHARDEYVEISSLQIYAAILHDFLSSF